MRIVAIVFLASILFFQLGYAQTTSCQLSDVEKGFVEDAIHKFVLDAFYTAGFSGVHPNGFPTKVHFAYASTLLGQIPFRGAPSDPGILESASLTELCRSPKTFDLTCRSQNDPGANSFWKQHDVCVEISCEAKGIYKADIKWKSLPQDKPQFQYSATKKQEIIYEPAPSVTWHLNDRVSGRLIVTGELLASARLKHQNGKTVRATYTGNVTAVSSEDEGLSSVVLNMSFPGLGSLTPLRAELLLHQHDASSANGAIKRGDTTLAELVLIPGMPLEITWISACQ